MLLFISVTSIFCFKLMTRLIIQQTIFTLLNRLVRISFSIRNILCPGSYSFQALLLCKKEMIYRDAGVAVRQVLSRVVGTGDKRNESFIIEEERINEEIHPDNYTRLSLDGLQPSTAVFDRWRLYKIHHFAIVAEGWKDLTNQVTCSLHHKLIFSKS